MASTQPTVSSRLDPDVFRRLQHEAQNRFFGNESMVVRSGVDLYLELREGFGTRYESVVEELRQRIEQERGIA